MTATITSLTFAQAKEMIDSWPNVVVADVREENEFATGHVEDAVNLALTLLIDVPEVEGRAFAAENIPSLDTPILVYCRTGKRSLMAARALVKFGYTAVYDMGGLSRWPYGLSYD